MGGLWLGGVKRRVLVCRSTRVFKDCVFRHSRNGWGSVDACVGTTKL